MAEENVIKCAYKPGTIEIPDKNFGTLLYEETSAHLSDLIVDVLNDRQLTRAKFLEEATSLAAGLLKLGYKKGDVIAIFSPNSLEWIIFCVATFFIDAVPAGLNFMSTPEELCHLLRVCKPRGIFCDQMTASTAVESVGKLKSHNVKHIIVNGKEEGCLSLNDVPRERFDVETLRDPSRSRRRDPCCILFSSGTTGPQKGVLLSHEGMMLEYWTSKYPEISATSTEKNMALAPMCHLAGFLEITHYMMSGGTMFFFTHFDFETYLRILQDEKITSVIIVPPVAVLLLKHPLVDKYKIHLKQVTVGAAPLGQETENEMRAKFPGLLIRQIYGMTETTASCSVSPLDPISQKKAGNIGFPIFNTEMKIVDVETGKNLGPNQTGEICVRSPLVMIGYVDNPEATAQTIDKNGWIHTGDIGHYDQDGYFFVTDRLKELIKYKGYQVAPAELESVLLSHPDVSDAAVVGVKDEMAGEVPLALVVLKPSAKSSESDIVSFLNGKVANHKKLRGGLKIVSYIPKSPSGKILRREIKASLMDNRL